MPTDLDLTLRANEYRDALLEDTLGFWLPRAVDHAHGGFLLALDRDGSILDDDKGIWQHGRFTWLLATLYTHVEPRQEWLDLAAHGIDFLTRHGFDDDGRMFFLVARDGRPLRKRRYVFSETFAAIAYAAFARASGDAAAADRARGLLDTILHHARTPGALAPKVDPRTRPQKGLALPMVLIATCQVLRGAIDEPRAEGVIDESLREIRDDFMKPDLRAVMETVAPDGALIDHIDGRLLNPGHAIEAAWFALEEAKRRGGDPALVRMGVDILDWMWDRGWDPVHGGLFYFRDVHGRPVSEYWHDMKFWWPHNEAVLAALLAWQLTGDERHRARYEAVHDWAHLRFPDPLHGEWFGYLHRDGTVSTTLKGNHWKGPFHLPRMQLYAWRILEQIRDGRVSPTVW